MKQHIAILAALAAGAFAMSTAEAHGGVSLSIGVGVPFVGVQAPVYVQPQPYYAPPPRAYYAPPPVVYAPPPPVRYVPAYGYAAAPVVYGDWHRERWARERYERDRWAREHGGWGR